MNTICERGDALFHYDELIIVIDVEETSELGYWCLWATGPNADDPRPFYLSAAYAHAVDARETH